MPTVRDLLKSRVDKRIWSLSPEMTLLQALHAMVEHNVGAMPVLEDGCLIGVLSERDYTRNAVVNGLHTNDTPVREAMTRDVITVTMDTTLEDCMRLMSEKHIRHLPVVEECQLVSHFSMRDLMQWMIDAQGSQIHNLQNFIEGTGYGQ